MSADQTTDDRARGWAAYDYPHEVEDACRAYCKVRGIDADAFAIVIVGNEHTRMPRWMAEVPAIRAALAATGDRVNAE